MAINRKVFYVSVTFFLLCVLFGIAKDIYYSVELDYCNNNLSDNESCKCVEYDFITNVDWNKTNTVCYDIDLFTKTDLQNSDVVYMSPETAGKYSVPFTTPREIKINTINNNTKICFILYAEHKETTIGKEHYVNDLDYYLYNQTTTCKINKPK